MHAQWKMHTKCLNTHTVKFDSLSIWVAVIWPVMTNGYAELGSRLGSCLLCKYGAGRPHLHYHLNSVTYVCFLRKVDTLPAKVLRAAADDMMAIASVPDMLAASPGNGSRSAIWEDLGAVTRTRLKARGDEGIMIMQLQRGRQGVVVGGKVFS